VIVGGDAETPEAGPGRPCFTVERLVNRANRDLSNGIGNLQNRTLSVVTKYLDGDPARPIHAQWVGQDLTEACKSLPGLIDDALERFDFRSATDACGPWWKPRPASSTPNGPGTLPASRITTTNHRPGSMRCWRFWSSPTAYSPPICSLVAVERIPFEVHTDGRRIYRREQLLTVANARDARWHGRPRIVGGR